jgi:hypothetical protein
MQLGERNLRIKENGTTVGFISCYYGNGRGGCKDKKIG